MRAELVVVKYHVTWNHRWHVVGVQHWHILVKLPNVLDTSVLARIVHDGRVARQQMKIGNIRPSMEETAWNMIEMGQLSTRYLSLFTESISQSSFYTERMNVDSHDASKVIQLEPLRKDYIRDYVAGILDIKNVVFCQRLLFNVGL